MPEFTKLARRPSVGSPTPWGLAQSVEEIGRGILFVSTSRHGGMWISPSRFLLMPEALRRIGAESEFHPEWKNYFEEDCEVSAVVVAFQDCFKAEQVEQERKFSRSMGGRYLAVADYRG